MDCPWDEAVLHALLTLSKIDDYGLPVFGFGSNLVNCKVLDSLLRCRNQFCGRLCVPRHSIPPCSSSEPFRPVLLPDC